MSRFYKAARGAMRFITAPLFRLEIKGKRELPDGAVIIVSNHISNWDVVELALTFNRQIHFMAKKELFESRALKRLMDGLGAFPIDRGGADVGAIRKSLALLKAGHVIGIFPQGTRVKDDGSFEMAGGASMIALRSHARIVPVHIKGDYKPFHKVCISVGEAFSPCTPEAKFSRDSIDALTNDIKARILALRDKN